MHVLVTGANGFVGRHLIHELQAHGHEVTAAIQPRTATVDHVKCVDVELTSVMSVAALVKNNPADACIHLAGMAFVPAAKTNPRLAIDVNYFGVINLLEAYRVQSPQTRILMVTSAEVYGRYNDGRELNEESLKDPASLYGVTKLSADLTSLSYARDFDMSIMTARPENHIGPGQSPNFVTSAFAQQLARIAAGEMDPVMQVGNLDSLRDFTDVRDVVRAYRLLIEQGQNNNAYNIASGNLRPIREILDGLCAAAGMQPEIHVDPALFRPTDSSALFDTSRIRDHVGWQPEVPIEQTIQDVYADFKTAFNIQNKDDTQNDFPVLALDSSWSPTLSRFFILKR